MLNIQLIIMILVAYCILKTDALLKTFSSANSKKYNNNNLIRMHDKKGKVPTSSN